MNIFEKLIRERKQLVIKDDETGEEIALNADVDSVLDQKYNKSLQQVRGFLKTRVKEEFIDNVMKILDDNLLNPNKNQTKQLTGDHGLFSYSKKTHLNRPGKVMAGSFDVMFQPYFKYFNETIIEQLLEIKGGQRPASGAGEVLMCTLCNNVKKSDVGDIEIDENRCEIKSLRGGGAYAREDFNEKLERWCKTYGANYDAIDMSPSKIGSLIAVLSDLRRSGKNYDEAVDNLAAMMLGKKKEDIDSETFGMVKETLKNANSFGPRQFLQRLAALQLKNYCSKTNSDLLIVLPEEKKYIWFPKNKIMETENIIKFGGWSSNGFLISKITM